METETMTVTDFLLARIVEDEAAAGGDKDDQPHLVPCGYWMWEDDAACECSYPARVLAECEAKRGIVDIHQIANADQGGGVGCMHCDWDREWGMPTTGGCDTLRYLALPYADHPDYREEWRA